MTAHSDPAQIRAQATTPSSILNVLQAFFSAIRQGFADAMVARSRLQQFQMLNAKSDDELAAMGLTRDRIAHHVFSDLVHI